MSRKFKLTIVVETTNDFNPKNFDLYEDHELDKFHLTRTIDESSETDLRTEFMFIDAVIDDVEEIKK